MNRLRNGAWGVCDHVIRTGIPFRIIEYSSGLHMEFIDSGRGSPIVHSPFTSITSPSDVCITENDVAQTLSTALVVLQQDFEDRKILIALENIEQHLGNGTKNNNSF